MTSAHEWLAKSASAWWPSVADHLWQSAVFVLVVLTATFLLKRGPARVRYSFWLLASAKILVPTGLLVVLLGEAGTDFLNAIFQGQQHAIILGGITAPVATLTNTYEITVLAGTVQHNEIYCALTAIWLAGVITLLGTWVGRRRNLARVLKRGERICSGREWNAFQNARKSLNLTTNVQLIVSPENTEPTVCGVFRPVLLVPEYVAEHLDDHELETIMLHELVHIQRNDNLIGSFQMIACAVFWFYPPVWFISRKLFDEREQACDEKVLEVYGAPERYAASILKVVRFCFGWKVAGLPGAAGGSNLRRRIENIMTKNLRSGTGARTRRFAAVFAGLTLLLMVTAGVYGSAANTNSAVSERTGSSEDRNTLPITFDSSSDESGQEINRKETVPPPPAPPAPSHNAQPPSPPNDVQPPSPPQAIQPPSAKSDMQPPSPPQNMQPPSAPQTSQPSGMPPPQPPALIAPVAPSGATHDPSQTGKKAGSVQDKKVAVVKGGLIEAPNPEYPEEAKKQKIEGTVNVSIVIGEEGNVIRARATSGPAILHEASVAAAFKARFKPSTADGKPVKVSGTMTYNFVLDK